MSADRSSAQTRGVQSAALFRASGYVARCSWQALDLVAVWIARRRQRRYVHQLSDHMLKDIGVSRADVEREAGKPFWRS